MERRKWGKPLRVGTPGRMLLNGSSSNGRTLLCLGFLLLMIEPVMAWTEKQQLALAIAPKFSGSLSIMGSVFIITDIIKSREKLGRTYSRILLCMSLYDFFTSIAQGLSTWPIPQGTKGIKFASGTQFTCNFQGFFTQAGVGAPMYNCSLSFYYLIVIAFAFSEDRVKQIEWFMHLIPLSFSIGSAIAGLPLTLYNSAGLWCWIAALPGTCVNGNKPEGEGECTRGEYAWIYRWTIYYGPVWMCVLTITFNMAAVSYLVWAKEKASNRFRFGHPSNLTSSSAASDGGSHYSGSHVSRSAGSHVSRSAGSHMSIGSADSSMARRVKAKAGKLTRYFASNRQKKRERRKQGLASQVFWQAFYYVLGFYITWIAPTLLRLLQTINKPVPFWIFMAMSILLPLQGFFNFLVYVRPRVVQYRNRHPENGLFNAIARAVRRTLTFMYVSDSRGFQETEAQDMEALDPCYALQVEKEEEVRRRSREARGMRENQKQQLDYEEDDEEPGSNHVEKAPGVPLTIMDQRRIDEMKLLEEMDPSFHEGESIRSSANLNVGIESGDFKTEASVTASNKGGGSIRMNGKVDNGSSKDLSESARQSVAVDIPPDAMNGSSSRQLSESGRQQSFSEISDLGEGSAEFQPPQESNMNGAEEEKPAKKPPKRKRSSRSSFYPKFFGEPDFFFT